VTALVMAGGVSHGAGKYVTPSVRRSLCGRPGDTRIDTQTNKQTVMHGRCAKPLRRGRGHNDTYVFIVFCSHNKSNWIYKHDIQ